MAQPASSVGVFTVRRSRPVLVAPAKPTPRDFKLLSDIDDQNGLRFQLPMMHFYRHESSMKGKDPAQVIKRALAHTLVFYYPFAGRLRQGPGRKLMVDCNGEGVIFIEADADVTLHQFGDALQPPFPCFEELLYNAPDSEGIINCPLLLVQITPITSYLTRTIESLLQGYSTQVSDGLGIIQFLKAMAEIAGAAPEPSTPPVWQRELLNARNPPRITCTHHEFEEVPDDEIWTQPMAHRSFFFGPKNLKAIRQLVSHHNGQYTTFEVLTAFLWRCRTIALQLEPDEEVRIMCAINVRGIKSNPPLLPLGYYGNSFVFPAAVTTSKKLCKNSFGYALELVRKAKGQASVEYVRSVADLMVIKGRPFFTMARSWMVSNMTRLGLRDVDFGWGKAAYGGPAMAGAAGTFPGLSFYVACQNAKGEEGIAVPMYLPLDAMARFTDELDHMLGNLNNNQDSKIINSCM